MKGVLARVFVHDLAAAIPLYQELAQVIAVNRVPLPHVELAQIGLFLPLTGNTSVYRDRVATIRWGSITGSGLGGQPGWDHRRVIFSVVYLLVRRLLGCLNDGAGPG